MVLLMMKHVTTNLLCDAHCNEVTTGRVIYHFMYPLGRFQKREDQFVQVTSPTMAVSTPLACCRCRHCPQSQPSSPAGREPPDAVQLLDSAWHGTFVGTSLPAGTAQLQLSDGGPTARSFPSRARSPVAAELPSQCSAGCVTRMDHLQVPRPSGQAAAAPRSHHTGSSAAPHNPTAGPFGAASSSVNGSSRGTSCGYSGSSSGSSGDLRSRGACGAASSCWKEGLGLGLLHPEHSGALPTMELSAADCAWADGAGGVDGGCSSGSGSDGHSSPSIAPIGVSPAAGECWRPRGSSLDLSDSEELLALSRRVKRSDGRQGAQGPRHAAGARHGRGAPLQRPSQSQKLGALPQMTAV